MCDKYLDSIWGSTSLPRFGDDAVTLLQFVLPRWMETVPCPPQVEMINTTSLRSHIASMQKKKEGQTLTQRFFFFMFQFVFGFFFLLQLTESV